MKKLILIFSTITFIIIVSLILFVLKYPSHVEYPHLVPLFWKIPYTLDECGGENFNLKVLDGINNIRVKTKKRYKVFSGYRHEEKNKKVGGATKSQHLKGNAVDLWVPQNEREKFYIAAKSSGFTAFGWGNRSVHIDIGKRRWWTYDNMGKQAKGNRKCDFIFKAPDNFKKDFKTCK